MPEKEEIKETENKEEKSEKTEKKKLSKAEYEQKVLELADTGLTSEKIGEALRKQGIHPQEYGKISRILKEKGKYIIPEIKNVEKKLEILKKHSEKNDLDEKAKREKDRIFSQLSSMKKYFKVAIN